MKVGFTGTQVGMTVPQNMAAYELVLELGATEISHGDCIGADDQMDQIAKELGIGVCVHPPTVKTKRAWCNQRPHGEIWNAAPEPYLQRNRAVVDATRLLIATPKEREETLRSGTWSTVRYARKQRKPVRIIWPDGTVT